jgi:hypothetical protein
MAGHGGGGALAGSIEGYLASTMMDYAHCFRSTVDRFATEGKDRDYFHSAQVCQPASTAHAPSTQGDRKR